MAAIVTGATGFIGGHLVDALSRAGEEVRCLVRRPVSVTAPSMTRFVHADFQRTDLGIPSDTLDNIDVVYHVAGATRATSAAQFRDANVGVTERLLDRIAATGATPRFVYISSLAAVGPARGAAVPVTEADTPAPIEAYGRSKLMAEELVRSHAGALPYTIIRPPAVYGPNDRDFLAMFEWLARGLAVYPGIRDAVITLIHVDDLVRGIIAAAQSSAAQNQTYFLGHPTHVSWREIYRTAAVGMGRPTFREVSIPLGAIRIAGWGGDLVGALTGRPPLISSGKAALAAPRFWVCSSDRAQREIGFAARTSLDHGLRTTYEWYRGKKWL